MPERRFFWVDAFTDRPMAGNPCAVVFDGDGVPEETRIAFTRETGLVETSFLVATERADFGARYYLQTGEIPMAGHPTVATAAALDTAGLLEGRQEFTLELGAGVFEIAIDRAGTRPVYTMTQRAPEFGRSYEAAEIAPLVGLEPEAIVGRPQSVSTGGHAFCVTLLRDRAALERATLDAALLGERSAEVDFWEPYLCTLGGFTERGDTAARLLLPPPGPAEDPFTGSATGTMAAYLWHHGLIGEPRFIAEQGHGMGRPGHAQVEVLGPPEEITGVRVGGSAVVLFEGRLAAL